MPTPLRKPTPDPNRGRPAHLEQAIVLRETLFGLQICRDNQITDDEALDLVGRVSGTSSGWVPMTQESMKETNERHGTDFALHVACDDYPLHRVHFIAEC